MITTLCLLAPAAGAAQDADAPRWEWERTNRYVIQTKVQLPLMMWWMKTYNKQARVDYFELDIVTRCGPGEPERRNTWEVDCLIEDIAIRAEALPQERGLLDPIVVELDERLTGATIQLQVRSDGRITNIDLEDVDRRNRRFGMMNENMRLVLSRAFAGLDLPLPESGEDAWYQYDSWLTRAPAADGSSGSSEIVHQIVSRSDGVLQIATAGRAMIVPGEGQNKYDTRLTSDTAFDLRTGRMLDRTWTLAGGPTASSAIAMGTEGFPYLQSGRILALTEGQDWQVGETGEMERHRAGQSAIQQDMILGVPPEY